MGGYRVSITSQQPNTYLTLECRPLNSVSENCVFPPATRSNRRHHIAKVAPNRPAIIMAGLGLPPGQEPEIVTYQQLEERSNQLAHLFRSRGLKRGDTVAMFMSNSARYHEVAWAAQRAGLRFVCCSSKLAAAELQYIVEDSAARIVIASPDLIIVARQLAARMQWRPDMEFLMVSDPDPVGLILPKDLP